MGAVITNEQLKIATLEAKLKKIRDYIDTLEHGGDCSRTDECENIEYDSKARYHCNFHGEDQCPPCECGLRELMELLR